MGKVIDVDKTGIGALLHELKVDVFHKANIGIVYAAAGYADIACEHGQGVDQANGEPALYMALQAIAAPDMGGMILRQQLRQNLDGLGGKSGGFSQFGGWGF